MVFKGFAEQADSFGCVKYTAEDFQKKAIGGKGVTPSTEICGCCALDWTGSFSLTASNLEVREEHAQTHADARTARCSPSPLLLKRVAAVYLFAWLAGWQEDINAPPDVMAVYERTPLSEMLSETGRLFCVGLCYDLCVIDTVRDPSSSLPLSLPPTLLPGSPLSSSSAAPSPLLARISSSVQQQQQLTVSGLTGCSGTQALNATVVVPEVYLVGDASRAVHIPGVGKFGSGFLADPENLASQMRAKGVSLVRSSELLAKSFG